MTNKVYCKECKYYEYGITAPTAYGAWCIKNPKNHKSLWYSKYDPNKNNDCKDFEER